MSAHFCLRFFIEKWIWTKVSDTTGNFFLCFASKIYKGGCVYETKFDYIPFIIMPIPYGLQ